MTRGKILIPLEIAEMLFVTLSVAKESARFDERTKQNLSLILDAYRARRDDFLRRQGISEDESSAVTEAAAESIANWLDDRALKADLEDEVFDEFEADYNSSSPEAGAEVQGSDVQVRRDQREAPPGGGWDPDGGGTDPGGQETHS